jgi:pimeloyl-ACP methyl ester carboxylesterase
MATLGEFEGSAWDSELEAAWSSAWVFILTAMQSGYGVSQDTLVASTRLGLAPEPSETPRAPEVPETRYLETPETLLAYQTYGSGPQPLLVMPGFLGHLELAWKGEASARFLHELGTQGEVLVFDRRGCGLTDRSGGVGGLEQQVADALTLLDSQDIDSAVILASDHAVPVALALLAQCPERFRGAVLYAGHAKLVEAGDFVAGHTPAEFTRLEELVTRAWGQRDLIEVLAPSRAHDPEFCAWLGDFLRGSANPREALRALRAAAMVDVRDRLDRIEAPVLLLHRTGDRFAPLSASQYLAARLRHVALVELPGADHLPYVGDTEHLLFEVFRFLSSLELESR